MEDTEDASQEQEQLNKTLTSVLEILGVKELKEIESEVGVDQSKIKKAKKKTAAKIQQMQTKVDEYFDRINLQKLDDNPEVSLGQIEKAEKQMLKVGNYIYSEMIKVDENEDIMTTYEEKIQQVQSILNSTIKEGNKKDFKNIA